MTLSASPGRQQELAGTSPLCKAPHSLKDADIQQKICLISNFKLSKPLFSCSVMSNSLLLHGLLQARVPCPSSSSRVWSNSGPLSQWCHLIISSSVIPFSSCLPSLPASGSFPVNRLLASDGQSFGASSVSVLPINVQDWFPLGLNSLIPLLSNGLLKK